MDKAEEFDALLKRLGSDFDFIGAQKADEAYGGVQLRVAVVELAKAVADRIELQEKELRILQDAFFRQSLRIVQ